MTRIVWLWLAMAAGCGFEPVRSGDLAQAADGATGDQGATDDASDDGGAPADLAGTDAATAGGPGPLGALPTGYCCTTNAECAGRRCVQSDGGASYCADQCIGDPSCLPLAGYACDKTRHVCAPSTSPACTPASQFHAGTGLLGACCSSRDQCLGGNCTYTGVTGNPYYCTQGCTTTADCPNSYLCVTSPPYTIDERNCEKMDPFQNVGDTYTCF